jgi:LysR family transcriptional activator of nhaA
MDWLNYHHLFYFWTVARAGSIARASQELRLSQPTLSNQLKTLQGSLGQQLFERQGRRLVLTDVGRTALRYADDIFRTGRELQQALKGLPTGARLRLVAGVADVIPKRVAALLLEPAVRAVPRLALVCRESPSKQLLAELALHEIDVVLSDSPASEEIKVRAFNHPLVDCGVVFLAARRLAALKKGFPRSLDGAPVLLPAPGTAVRRGLASSTTAPSWRPSARAARASSPPPPSSRRRWWRRTGSRRSGAPRRCGSASTPSRWSAACGTPPWPPSPTRPESAPDPTINNIEWIKNIFRNCLSRAWARLPLVEGACA